ncbi:MAG: hypothetical protein IJ225_04590 [Solobacterium sp.]|nr:hypothetical protein [Solobacterium sp.]
MFDDVPKENPPRYKELRAKWIHDRKEDPSSVNGYFILPACVCSNCGYRVGSERDRCPQCKANMK